MFDVLESKKDIIKNSEWLCAACLIHDKVNNDIKKINEMPRYEQTSFNLLASTTQFMLDNAKQNNKNDRYKIFFKDDFLKELEGLINKYYSLMNTGLPLNTSFE